MFQLLTEETGYFHSVCFSTVTIHLSLTKDVTIRINKSQDEICGMIRL